MRAFTKGSPSRKARGLVAERILEREGVSKARAFAMATGATKRMSNAAVHRVAKRRDNEGLRPRRSRR